VRSLCLNILQNAKVQKAGSVSIAKTILPSFELISAAVECNSLIENPSPKQLEKAGD
jgi:hypothetical protein